MDKIINLITCNYSVVIGCFVFVSIFIEISPIQMNPLSSLCKWIGNNINKDIKDKLSQTKLIMDNMQSQLNKIQEQQDRLEVNDMRSQILDFSNSAMNGRRHTQEEFDHIISVHTDYEKLIKSRNLTNGKVELAIEYIKDLYAECLRENSFLK